MARFHHKIWAALKKPLVLIGGGLVLLAGIIMLFTPGQGILAILLGLGILGTEYHWARRASAWIKAKFRALIRKVKRGK